jgi:PAS domain S-box-containing protein
LIRITVRLLYVGDDPQTVNQVRRVLAQHAPEIELQVAPGIAAALDCLRPGDAYDLVLADTNLPDGDGLSLLAHIRERGWPLAVVLVASGGSEETVVAALKAGADDYVLTRADYLEHLPGALRNALERRQAETARHSRPLRVLYAEDNSADILLTQHHLSRHARHIQLEVVGTAADLMRRLFEAGSPTDYDVLMLDYRLPGHTALEVLRELEQVRGWTLPVVVVTGQGDEELALQVLRLGASDYVVKNPGYLYKLPFVLENAYHRAQLQREQAALRQSEAKHRNLVEQIPAVTYIMTLDEPGQMLYVSPQVASVLGYAPAEFLAGPDLWRQHIHPDDQPRLRASLQRARRDGESLHVEFRWVRPDGRIVWLRNHASVVRETAGQALFLQGVMVDVTEQRQAEAQLAYQAHLLANIHDAVIATDAAGRLTAWNRAAEALYGWNAAEVLGRPATDVIRANLTPEQQSAAARSLGSLGHFRLETVQHTRGGIPVVVEGTTIALHDEAGAISGYVSVYRDISERKQAEAERERLHRQVREAHRGLQALSLRLLEVQEAERRHIARELHDEIGQQLTGLKLLIDMNAHQPGKPVRSSLSEAQEMLQHLMNVVRELSLSLRPAMLDDLGLLPALLWHLERYTTQTNVEVRFHHSGIEAQRFPTEVETAAFRIVQEALTNVARYAQVATAHVRLWRETTHLHLEVSDRGRGFDPYTALAANRSSGLAGMSERASLLGGKFQVESAAGRGTRLTAVLPVDFDLKKRDD